MQQSFRDRVRERFAKKSVLVGSLLGKQQAAMSAPLDRLAELRNSNIDPQVRAQLALQAGAMANRQTEMAGADVAAQLGSIGDVLGGLTAGMQAENEKKALELATLREQYQRMFQEQQAIANELQNAQQLALSYARMGGDTTAAAPADTTQRTWSQLQESLAADLNLELPEDRQKLQDRLWSTLMQANMAIPEGTNKEGLWSLWQGTYGPTAPAQAVSPMATVPFSTSASLGYPGLSPFGAASQQPGTVLGNWGGGSLIPYQ
jgi:hypothetical protein